MSMKFEILPDDEENIIDIFERLKWECDVNLAYITQTIDKLLKDPLFAYKNIGGKS